MKEYFIWLAKFLTVVLIVFVIMPVLMISMMGAAQVALNEKVAETSRRAIAVVEVKGVIDESKEIVKELYKQAANPKVRGIVLRINSPGGAVGPSQEIYNAVKKIKERKPIVASMESMAASGGLYSALSASKIYCLPGTLTGSIGVIMQIPNFKRVTDMIGVDVVTIKSGALKDVGNSFREMAPEEKEFLQQTINRVNEDFIQAVVDGRKIPREEVLKFADGRVIMGSQAKELKLIDDFGDIYDAARAVFDILGEPLKPEEMPELFYPGDKFSQFRKLLDNVTSLPDSLQGRMQFKYLMH
jgi:protease IV